MTNEQKIGHLYSRAGFGLSPQMRKKRKQSLNKAIKQLFVEAKAIKAVKVPYYNFPTREAFKQMSKTKKRAIRKEVQALTKEVNANWMTQMMSDASSPLQEKMTFFWHGHFACESKRFDFAARQINTIRTYALGNFRDLVLAISKDAAMIMYLNNQQNRKHKPNENYARELMELFTIGRGNYTEKDIKESARAFTGWFTDRLSGDFAFNKRQHDFGEKTFMGRTGNFDGDDIIDIILEQKATATFIARKVYRFFVNDKVNEKHLAQLADVFYQSNYDIATMMRTLFESDWFYAKENVGCKIKSPIELLVGLSRHLGITFNTQQSVLFPQMALGQTLFRPPNVAGWPGGKAWIDNSTLMLRLNLVAVVFQQGAINVQLKNQPEMKRHRKIDRLDLSADLGPLQTAFKDYSISEVGQQLSAYLLQVPVDIEGTFIEKIVSMAKTEEDKFRAYVLGLLSLPEYQMC